MQTQFGVALAYLQLHAVPLIVAYVAGAATTNTPWLIQKFVAIKWVTAAIRKDPALAKAIVSELQKDVDAVADGATAPSSDAKAAS